MELKRQAARRTPEDPLVLVAERCAPAKLGAWRRDFNEIRRHKSLGFMTPADEGPYLSSWPDTKLGQGQRASCTAFLMAGIQCQPAVLCTSRSTAYKDEGNWNVKFEADFSNRKSDHQHANILLPMSFQTCKLIHQSGALTD
jgi:hypothetical protein